MDLQVNRSSYFFKMKYSILIFHQFTLRFETNMISFKTHLLLAVALVQQVTSISLMETLLKSTIQSAQCEARCHGLDSQEDLQDCLDVCRIVVKNPDSSLCMFPRLCTGGCRVACQDQDTGAHVDGSERRISTIAQSRCQLSWEVNSHEDTSIVFIIAGLDHAGMISIISRSVQDSQMEISPSITSKYASVTVLAVDSQGLVDLQKVDLEHSDECQDSNENQNDESNVTEKGEVLFEASQFSFDNSDEVSKRELPRSYSLTTLTALTISSFVVFSLALALVIHFCKKRKPKTYQKCAFDEIKIYANMI